MKTCHMLRESVYILIHYPVFKKGCVFVSCSGIHACLYYHRSIWDVLHSWGDYFTQTSWTEAHNSMQNNQKHCQWGVKRKEKSQQIFQLLQQMVKLPSVC